MTIRVTSIITFSITYYDTNSSDDNVLNIKFFSWNE